jgi:hypothetical protein
MSYKFYLPVEALVTKKACQEAIDFFRANETSPGVIEWDMDEDREAWLVANCPDYIPWLFNNGFLLSRIDGF